MGSQKYSGPFIPGMSGLGLRSDRNVEDSKSCMTQSGLYLGNYCIIVKKGLCKVFGFNSACQSSGSFSGLIEDMFTYGVGSRVNPSPPQPQTLKNVHSHRDGGCPGRDPHSCPRF